MLTINDKIGRTTRENKDGAGQRGQREAALSNEIAREDLSKRGLP
jgi:hypothetical protein